MPAYKVTGRMARISSGVLELSEAQASGRMHALKRLSGKKYDVLRPVEFKQGEEFGYLGELPKTLAEDLTAKAEADAQARKAEAQAKREAEQRADEEKRTREAAEAKAKQAWDADEALRKQYDGDFSAYLVAALA